MLLYHYIGFKPYLGSVTASIIGYTTSVIIGLYHLRKENGISYRKTLTSFGKNLIPIVVMAAVLIVINYFLPFDVLTMRGALKTIIINATVGGIIYIGISFKSGLIYDVMGKDMVNSILKKLTLGKLNLK